MKKDELIYLASPYSNGNKEGYTTISPITYGHTLLQFKEMPDDWNFWLNFCLTLLTKCDRLVVCKIAGWEKSIGVEAEISYARDHGIPIEYYEVSNEYVHEIHKQEVIKKWEKAGFLDGLNLDNVTLPIAKRVFNTGIKNNTIYQLWITGPEDDILINESLSEDYIKEEKDKWMKHMPFTDELVIREYHK